MERRQTGSPKKRSSEPSKKRQIRGSKGVRAPHPPSRGKLRAFVLGEGLPPISKMREEIQEMVDVLMGREAPPLDAGYLTLMETADAYFARASEMTMLIQQAEVEGFTPKGGSLYKFRTGELRTFQEMCKRAADLGSRRLTDQTLRYEMEKFGRESKGFSA